MSFLAEPRIRFWWAIANLWLRLGCSEWAANTYLRVLRIRPDDPSVIFQRARCLIDVPHRRTEAIEALRQLLQRSPYALGSFLMGSALQMEGRDKEAVEAFEEAARRGGRAPADFYFNWGKSLAILRRREEAAEVLRQAALLEPSDVAAWRMLGATLVELGRWKDAAACQERVMRLQPSVVHGLELGGTLYELNRFEDAERVLRETLAIDSRSTDAKGLLAQVLSDQDRHSEAIELAGQIRAAAPNDIPPRLVMGHVLSWAGHFKEALREANAAAEIAPTESKPYNALGSIYIRMNDGEAALRSFDRMATCIDPAVERLPSTEWVWCYAGRGVALSLLDRHDEAMVAFEEALRIDCEFFERCRPFATHYQRSRRATGQSPDGAD